MWNGAPGGSASSTPRARTAERRRLDERTVARRVQVREVDHGPHPAGPRARSRRRPRASRARARGPSPRRRTGRRDPWPRAARAARRAARRRRRAPPRVRGRAGTRDGRRRARRRRPRDAGRVVEHAHRPPDFARSRSTWPRKPASGACTESAMSALARHLAERAPPTGTPSRSRPRSRSRRRRSRARRRSSIRRGLRAGSRRADTAARAGPDADGAHRRPTLRGASAVGESVRLPLVYAVRCHAHGDRHRIELLELDIDLRLTDLWREAAEVDEWSLEVVAALHAGRLRQGLLRRADRGRARARSAAITATSCPTRRGVARSARGAADRRLSATPGPRTIARMPAWPRKRSRARLVVALSVAAVLAVFLLYTSIAGGGTPSLPPSQLAGHRPASVPLAGSRHRTDHRRRATPAGSASRCRTSTARARRSRSSTRAPCPTCSGRAAHRRRGGAPERHRSSPRPARW